MTATLCAGFTAAKVVRDTDVSSPPASGWTAVREKVGKLLSGAAQQDPFYAVVAYKQ